MNMIDTLPSALQLNKQELVDVLLREEYGYLPKRPHTVTAEEVSVDKSFCAGKADLKKLSLTCHMDEGEFSFPVYYVAPKGKQNIPCFIHINFRDLIPDRFQPTEELIDMGYATLTFCYRDVTADNGDFTDGLAGIVYPDGKRKPEDCGKIGLWAWAAMAIMDYAQTLEELDRSKISVIGHSRLGKTALLAGALDERFYCAFSNDSGCGGAALARNNTGERIQNIVKNFPFWFCENYYKYVEHEDDMPFDQHWLIAANYPHMVYVASAVGDSWACPKNEYLSCEAASRFYESKGKTGLISPARIPEEGECFHDGNIGYHLRGGTHYLSREDWQKNIAFLNGKKA